MTNWFYVITYFFKNSTDVSILKLLEGVETYAVPSERPKKCRPERESLPVLCNACMGSALPVPTGSWSLCESIIKS